MKTSKETTENIHKLIEIMKKKKERRKNPVKLKPQVLVKGKRLTWHIPGSTWHDVIFVYKKKVFCRVEGDWMGEYFDKKDIEAWREV